MLSGAPRMAMGNTTIVIPSQRYPLAATDLYSGLETSDLPAGVVNIVTGDPPRSPRVLADTTTWKPCGIAAPARARGRGARLGVEYEAHLGIVGRAATGSIPSRRRARSCGPRPM